MVGKALKLHLGVYLGAVTQQLASTAKAATTAVHPATFATAPTECHRRRHAPSATAVRPATFAAAPTAGHRRHHAPRKCAKFHRVRHRAHCHPRRHTPREYEN